MYSFRGGPWDGFVIDYGERAHPDVSVHPDAADPPDDGWYLLNDGGSAYVWTDGEPANRGDGMSARISR